jgi:hypothetical protein
MSEWHQLLRVVLINTSPSLPLLVTIDGISCVHHVSCTASSQAPTMNIFGFFTFTSLFFGTPCYCVLVVNSSTVLLVIA